MFGFLIPCIPRGTVQIISLVIIIIIVAIQIKVVTAIAWTTDVAAAVLVTVTVVGDCEKCKNHNDELFFHDDNIKCVVFSFQQMLSKMPIAEL